MLAACAVATLAGAAFVGCASTEFYNEGPGQPFDRASAAVPVGMVGVCKRAFTQRPPIVSPTIWEHARPCKSDTPKEFIRIGYGYGSSAESKAKVDKMMQALREGPKEQAGNTSVLAMLRAIRAEGVNDKWLKDRITRESARPTACDFSYLLNTMEGEAEKLRGGDRCAVYAYDQVEKKESCLFDTSVGEAVWLTGTWACMTRTGTVGKGESCHRLCAYDDYCARQVSCAAPDIDLALCALGVCLPEPDGLGL